MDPFYAFAQYPSQTLEDSTLLVHVEKELEKSIEKLHLLKSLAMVNFAKAVLSSDEEIYKVLQLTVNGTLTAKLVADHFETHRQGQIFRSLVWLSKIGVLKITKAL